MVSAAGTDTSVVLAVAPLVLVDGAIVAGGSLVAGATVVTRIVVGAAVVRATAVVGSGRTLTVVGSAAGPLVGDVPSPVLGTEFDN